MKKLSNKSAITKRQVIAVLGVDKSVGVTHTCILLANYIRSHLHEKVCVLELNDSRDFQRLHAVYEMVEDKKLLNRKFKIKRVTYFSNIKESEVSAMLNEDYNYYILDLGYDFNRYMDELQRSNYKFIVGTLTDWKSDPLFKFIEKTKDIIGSKEFKYLILFAMVYELKELKDQYEKINAMPIPFAPNPFELKKEIKELFQKIL